MAYKEGPELTKRLNQVLALMAQGMNAREIGEALFISDKTVYAYTALLKDKQGSDY